MNKYNTSNIHKLRNMHSKNPKQYWRYLNNIDNKKPMETPELETMYKYFKDVNKPTHNDTNDNQIFDNIDTFETNNTLNCQITSDEINKCIKGLKNGKSAGTDCVLNEYIKSSKNKMISL